VILEAVWKLPWSNGSNTVPIKTDGFQN